MQAALLDHKDAHVNGRPLMLRKFLDNDSKNGIFSAHFEFRLHRWPVRRAPVFELVLSSYCLCFNVVEHVEL